MPIIGLSTCSRSLLDESRRAQYTPTGPFQPKRRIWSSSGNGARSAQRRRCYPRPLTAVDGGRTVRQLRPGALLVCLVLILVACAPNSPTSVGRTDGGSFPSQSGSRVASQRTLQMVVPSEPAAATPRVDSSGGFSTDVSARLFAA